MTENSYVATDSDKIVDIESATLRIGQRVLIEDLNLSLKEGARVGLTGPSGCGKTTLLRSIVGRRLSNGSSARRFALSSAYIGYVPQQTGMLPWYSVRRNFHIFGQRFGVDAVKWCEYILELLELTEVADQFPSTLSGGELQRARLGCGIAIKAALCCVDEPLTEVGLQQKWRILNRWSSEMSSANTSLLLISHDIDTLLHLCDEIVVLAEGNLGAKVVQRFSLNGRPHPRSLADLNNEVFESIRRNMLVSLYAPE
jgi:ABC-type multidrug transport system ATPase subunit